MANKRRLVFVLAGTLVCPPVLRAAACPQDPSHYNGYRVQHIEIRSSIGFFAAATFGFDALKARLPLQEGHPYSNRKMSEAVPLIRDYVQSTGSDGFQKVKFVIASGRPEDCDDASRTVNVVYRVFTNIYRPYVSHTFEERTAEVQRPSTTGAEGGTQGRYLVKPFGGYNRTRRGYGGVDFSSDVPLRVFRHVELHPSFSFNTAVVDADGIGSWNPRRKGLEHAEWRFGFHYRDTPAGSATLKEGKLAAQFLGSTKELLEGGPALRYGASLEGGHQQTGGVPQQRAVVAPNSSYGALKLYAGATGRSGRQSFTASYGAELGSTLTHGMLDFAKHVVDIGYSVRFLREPKPDDTTPPSGEVHKPWDIEMRAAGGIIQSLGRVPAAERFFGGNQVQPFIGGDTWVIPSGAFIRSIPENRLGGLGPGDGLGGTRFYSGNVTVAKVFWGRPLLPRELAQDPDFIPKLHGAISTVKGTLADAYKAKDPAYTASTSEVNAIADHVRELSAELTGLPAAVTSMPAVGAAVSTINSQVSMISRILNAVNGGKNNQLAALVNLQLPRLETEMANLEWLLTQAGQTAAATSISGLRASIETSRRNIKTDLAAVNTKGAQARAEKDFSAAQRVLNAFLYELNIYSIAPVAILDVARIWPASTGTRYAVGGGVRLSLVNVNFTVGYAANPKRQPEEGAGAFFVKLDVADLFH